MSIDRADTSAPTDGGRPTEGAEPVLTVSETALDIVLGVRGNEEEPERTALRVAVTGSAMAEFTYGLDLVPFDDLEPGDVRYQQGPLTVAVPGDSVENLRGAVLDTPSGSAGGGLVIKNPNTPDPLAGLDLDLSGDLPDKVRTVLDQAVNPALASHGGFASLVGVDGSRVFITMGGGCQGCAMSRMTLTEGIQKMLIDALPEVSEVVDATDHAAGENPFYS
jgi:Fe/S biogenesis protein NfuA